MSEVHTIIRHVTKDKPWELSPLIRGTFYIENKGPESIWLGHKNNDHPYRLDCNNNFSLSFLNSMLKIESDDAQVLITIQFYDKEEFAVWLLEQASTDAEDFAAKLLRRSAELIP